MKADHFYEPHWLNEKNWLCTVELFPTDDQDARLFCTEILGYLLGYAHITNTRALATVGDKDENAYEILFSFSSSEEKHHFLNLIRSNEDLGEAYIENDLLLPTAAEIRSAGPVAKVLPSDVFWHAMLVATSVCSADAAAAPN